jgi:hypothetical protein
MVAVASANSAGLPPSSDQVRFPAGLTRVDVMVQGSKGACVSGLTLSDFEVLGDGQPRPIEFFSSGTSALTMVVLVDITASMPGAPNAGVPFGARPGEPIQLAVEGFPLKGVHPGDRLRFGAIRRHPSIGDRFATDAREYAKAWREMFVAPPVEWLGPSPIWDAVAEATRVLEGEPGERAVALLSDGMASGNTRSWRDVARQAALAGVSVNVMLEDTGKLGADLDPEMSLKAIADATGGVQILPPGGVRVQSNLLMNRSSGLTRVLDCLHGAYVIGFAPAIREGGSHLLTVRARRPDVSVRARKIYGPRQ